MSTDLKNQLRALIDAASPVSADEAIARAVALPSALSTIGAAQPRRSRVRTMTVAASAVVLAGAGAGWAFSASSKVPTTKHAIAPPKVVLTAAEIRAITMRSSAAASSSGTAEVTETSRANGVPQDGYDTAVIFAGQNIDEKITAVPEPPGSANSFTTDDRLVDGQFFIHTPGPGDILEWLHDTNSANDAASMQFPDPRTLYRAISPGAQFSVAGTTTMNGAPASELVAGDPAAITTTALGNFALGAVVTSFEVWVDSNDVVQQLAFSTSQTARACRFLPLTSAQRQELGKKYGETVTLPNKTDVRVVKQAALHAPGGGRCGPMTTVTDVTIAFANLGVPQSVTAPQEAVDFAGKG